MTGCWPGAIEAGIDGLEVWHSQHDDELRRSLAGLAERRGPLATGGRDYHGRHKLDVRVGSGTGGNVAVPGRTPGRPAGGDWRRPARLSRLRAGSTPNKAKGASPNDAARRPHPAAGATLTVATARPDRGLVRPGRGRGQRTPDWGAVTVPDQRAGQRLSPTWAAPYLGGSFTQVNNTTCNRLAACNATTGALLPWNPNANNVVRALKVSPAGTRVYVGGDFSAVGGAARSRVAALSPSSGAAFGWNPYVNDQVKSITTSNSGSTVYAGGDFDSAEGAGRHHLAAFNATSGNLTSLKPTISDGTGNFATVLSMDVSADGNTLYFAGDFALVNGSSRRNAAAVSSGIGTLRAWSPASTAGIAAELTVSASGNTVSWAAAPAGGYVQAYGPNAGGTRSERRHRRRRRGPWPSPSSILYVGGQLTSVGGGPATRPPSHLRRQRPLEPRCQRRLGASGRPSPAPGGLRGEPTQVHGEAHSGVVQFSGTPQDDAPPR